MSERKNIDRLFQEKFKEFEAKPSEDLWSGIEAKLNEKKKRRVLPFWWKLSGVAAVFLIGFLISKSIYNDGIKTENQVVNETNSNENEKANDSDSNPKKLDSKGSIPGENPIVNEDNVNKTNTKNSESEITINSIATNAAEPTSKVVENSKFSEPNNKTKKTIYSSKSGIAEGKSSRNRSLKNNSNTDKVNLVSTESVNEKLQNQVAQNINNNKLTTEKELVQIDGKKKNSAEPLLSGDKKNITLDDLKGTINSKIATKEIEKKVNDTASKNSVANNELEELLNEKESKLKQESKRNRWQLTSNVAPIFLGSVSNGSAIDPSLSKNSKSYNTNVGYGIGVGYALNKKLSVRTGLNKVNMSYDTNDISFFTGLQAKTLQNVSPAVSSAMIHVESAVVSTTVAVPSETGLLPFEDTFAHKTVGLLRQEIGYLEMPVELTYDLLDQKFGVKLIGGFSTLLLQDNSIRIISEGRDTLLGEANNLNDVHFSTNLGLGLKYNFLKSFEFNVEPTVKYQLNTYSANAGNFKPYFFGIYSGISYKF